MTKSGDSILYIGIFLRQKNRKENQQIWINSEMDFSSSVNILERWKQWKQTIQLYLDIAMADKTEADQCKTLLYVIGKEGREIFNTFTFAEAEKDKLDKLLEKFENYCIPKKM